MNEKRNQVSLQSSTNETKSQRLDKRRAAVRKIVGGGVAASGAVLGNAWLKPAVNSVILPSHALTTADIAHGDDSIEDPVFLSYTCSSNDVLVTADGFINLPIAGIEIFLVFSWDSQGNGQTQTSPREITVFTANDGTYTTTQNIGHNTFQVSVTASLPNYPEAGEVMDQIPIITSGGSAFYYCAAPPPVDP